MPTRKRSYLEEPYEALFQAFLRQIDRCMKTNLPEAEQLQNCFWIAVKCNKKLKKLVLVKGFVNEAEEIRFFREVKPKFACFTEFFVIACEALWYISTAPDDPVILWKEEMKRYSRF